MLRGSISPEVFKTGNVYNCMRQSMACVTKAAGGLFASSLLHSLPLEPQIFMSMNMIMGCSFFAYNWKLPAYNWASLLTVVEEVFLQIELFYLQWELSCSQWEACASEHLNGL